MHSLIKPVFLSIFVPALLLSGFAFSDEPAKSKHTNRLAKETSPYLLGHSHNPVDWFPWGEEALAKARKEGKLILLSSGYASCHWCHVMERESFEDQEIAALLNKHYVCIKVDREERPDVDHQYQTALRVFQQLAGGRGGGGWPLTMILTPDAQPIFGGTYFPARDGDRGQAMGFISLLARVQTLWTEKTDRMKEDAATITQYTKRELEGLRLAPLVKIDEALVTSVQAALAEEFDSKFGGFGYNAMNPLRPKFPEPSNLLFLLDRVKRTMDEKASELLTFTLEKMAAGGIYDHIGGGFHRYSVDRMWRIPHFEKMLYDNGQLASIYADAGELLDREDFRRVARETCDFLLREMRDPTGGYWTALDADSEGEEGKFYRWTPDEAQATLTKEEFELAATVYGLAESPNFDEKWYALQFAKPLAEIAKKRMVGEVALVQQLQPIREKLLAVRNKRVRPLTDTKILTGENGLAIRGLADAGRLLKEPRYIAAAEQAADFVLQKLRVAVAPNENGRLLRTYGGGQAKLNAYLNDYAFLVDGLLALHLATGAEKWLTTADELTAQQIALFADNKSGGFFFTSTDHEALFARTKDPVDGALPSGNSLAASNLLAIARLLKKADYVERAERTIQSTGALLQSSPTAVVRMATNIPALLEAKAEP